jgi:hypothetical protein
MLNEAGNNLPSSEAWDAPCLQLITAPTIDVNV